ncbi:glycerophosphocholine phosphodiesterase GPCPD1-like isoform X2 [Lycorma delicatula]|uniref:glycerophosphocholine phosphodiesterase GPCPD1-like isoform X2 n=1 Tax=Lycorma delicatula TaxID=130591 RepID=UPI003F50F7F1
MLQWWNNDNLLRPKEPLMLEVKDTEDAQDVLKKEVIVTADEGPLREWVFNVKVDCMPGEHVCITGSAKTLGQWQYSNVLLLNREPSEGSDMFFGKAMLPKNHDTEYRYCICVIVEPEISKLPCPQFVVRRWESFSPRVIRAYDTEPKEIDIFGYYNGKEENIAHGWLTSACVIQLKLFNNPIQFWKKKLLQSKINVKVTPVNLSKAKENLDSSSRVEGGHSHLADDTLSLETFETHHEMWPITEIAVLNEAERHFQFQEQFGHVYNEGDFMIFQIQVLAPETIAYLVDFYTYSSGSEALDPPYHIGFSCILPSSLKASEGQIVVPVTSVKHQPIGQVTVEYLVVKPISDYNLSMQSSMQTNWKETWRGLDVGHRGVGSSFAKEQNKCADVRENTIASLKSAASCGADFVEFDVQLSRDLVPVLYHDFYVCISMKKKKDADCDTEMLQLPLKDLSLDQLHLLKLYHVEEGRNKNSRFSDEHLEEHQPFPTLKEALEVLDPSVGFNVEVKWTMKLSDGTYELNHPFDLNLFLDVVLKDVLTYAGSRLIVFSCFHPDICTMIQLKQNRYPVMFLTQCITKKYPVYYDPRCQTIPMAVHFTVCMGILGVNVHTEELLRDSSQVNLIKDAGLVLFCWGEDNNDTDTIRYLKDMGLHGVIYDKIDKFSCKEVKESIFRLEARESERMIIKAAAEKAERKSKISSNFSTDQSDQESTVKRGFIESMKGLDMDQVHDISTKMSGSTSSGLSIWSVDQYGSTVSDSKAVSSPVVLAAPSNGEIVTSSPSSN